MNAHYLSRDAWTVAILTLLSLATAFPAVMSTLAPYDDQGYVMITLQSFLNGETLYSRTHTQYGPAYYLLTGSLHEVLGIPLNQDGVRLKTVAFWSLSTMLAYFIQRRLGVHRGSAFLTSSLFHLHLHKLALEPGHPQEWILMLSLLSFWMIVGGNKRKHFFAAVLVGLIGMIKINCGFLFAIPLLAHGCVTAKQFNAPKTIIISIILGGATSAILIGSLSIVLGVSLEQLAWGMIGQHRGFSNDFFHSIPMSWLAVGYACICLWLITKVGIFRSSKSAEELFYNSHGWVWQSGLVFFGIAIGAFHILLDWSQPLVHGLEPRGAANWLILAGPAISLWLLSTNNPQNQYAIYIALTVWSAPMMAYPTPGTQLSLGTAPSWIVFGILLSNCWNHRIAKSSNVISPETALETAAHRPSYTMVYGISLLLIVLSSSMSWYRWLSYSAVELPGTELLRLPRHSSEKEFAIAKAILRMGCDQVVFDGHNHNRFFFWTSTEPLTPASPTFWPRMLTIDEQTRILTSLASLDRVCMVIPPESDQLASPKTEIIRQAFYDGFEEMERIDDWRIGIIRPKAKARD